MLKKVLNMQKPLQQHPSQKFHGSVLQGPNLNLLGTRNPDIYGKKTLEEIHKEIAAHAFLYSCNLKFFQSNHEGALIDFLQENHTVQDFILLNAGALTHYSYALRDAIECCLCPIYEIHLSNIYEREDFRKISVLSSVCSGTFYGEGVKSYTMAIDHYFLNFNSHK